MEDQKTVFVAGHKGMVGSAILRKLNETGYKQILVADRNELDLLDQSQVQQYFSDNSVSQVYLSAAKVGGIHANNKYPADFIYQNLVIEANVINACHLSGVNSLLFLGSSCIYPKNASQPMSEEALLTGSLEPTNEPYAVAKIAGIKLCESYNRQYGRDYRSVMPTNLYGPNDNFHPENSHVIPALMRRIHEAKLESADSVTIWGSGSPMREFLHVDDMASACLHIMNLTASEYQSKTQPMLSHVNVGTGHDCSIRQLAEIISGVIGYRGQLDFDDSKPDGAPRKLMDVSRLNSLGWKASIDLEEGLKTTYSWFLENIDKVRSK